MIKSKKAPHTKPQKLKPFQVPSKIIPHPQFSCLIPSLADLQTTQN